MKLTILVFFLTLLIELPKPIEKKIDKEIKTIYNLEEFTKEPVEIPNDLLKLMPGSVNPDGFYKIVTGGEIRGYFYFGFAPSKADKFDFLVIFDKELIISKIKILAYREDYGGEISSNRWLSQFNNLKPGDNPAYGNEIMAISGATISGVSMTKAVNDLLESIEILHDKNLF
jgi:hypothetical protein